MELPTGMSITDELYSWRFVDYFCYDTSSMSQMPSEMSELEKIMSTWDCFIGFRLFFTDVVSLSEEK